MGMGGHFPRIVFLNKVARIPRNHGQQTGICVSLTQIEINPSYYAVAEDRYPLCFYLRFEN